MPFRKAWKDGNRSAYDSVDSLKEVPVAYARCRKTQYFILSADGAAKSAPKCDACGEPVVDRKNRGEYEPKERKTVLYHYNCAWGVTLDAVNELEI